MGRESPDPTHMEKGAAGPWEPQDGISWRVGRCWAETADSASDNRTALLPAH